MIRALIGQWVARWRRQVWRDRLCGRAFRWGATFCHESVGSPRRRAAAACEAFSARVSVGVAIGSSVRSRGAQRAEVSS